MEDQRTQLIESRYTNVVNASLDYLKSGSIRFGCINRLILFRPLEGYDNLLNGCHIIVQLINLVIFNKGGYTYEVSKVLPNAFNKAFECITSEE
jgi:hypothetical protein